MPAVTTELPPTPAAAARPGQTWRIVLAVNGVIALVVAGMITAVLWSVTSTFESVERIPFAFPPAAERPAVVTGEAAAAQNFLLLGSDNRGEDGSLANLAGQHSDTIVVVHIPADRSGLSIMSIPRDSWVPVPGHGETSISSALSLGGVPLAVQTVESLIGVRVDHVALVDFAGFEAVTDALGGVSIDNPVAFDSYYLPGRTFAAGAQHLDGAEALAFARERAAFAGGDMQRVQNQQLLIKALLGGVLQAETLTNPSTVGSVVGAVTPHLAIDEQLTSGDLVALGVAMREVRAEDVAFFTIPTAGTDGRTTDEGHPIVNIDWQRLPGLQEAFRSDTVTLAG
ncbi:LCP family protein [Cryobacterium sp. 1639]|uniref:LCP family protein n=1 Tax=Cryobacterium inferilacus TaxID=2866629 RepID=UPI001C7360A8|nr:LCP family protein [Cryobacterium sp. 1639]MBX0299890.1 LCP family protein [Cryobacterium sp. 1639]